MTWSCSAVRRRLAEYHDGELTIERRVAVQEHLRACPACEAEAQALKTVSSALRSAAAERACGENWSELDGLASGVVSRFRAEREESLSRTVQRMFEDLHLVWAALGATTATFACLALTLGIFYFSRAERPDSLAAIISALSSGGSEALPIVSNAGSDAHPIELDDNAISLPRQQVNQFAALPELTNEEIMLDTTITREGRVASLQLVNPEGPSGVRQATDWKTVGNVLDSVAQARFAPARVGGEPVAVKMLWFLTQTTVRPKTAGRVHRAIITHVA